MGFGVNITGVNLFDYSTTLSKKILESSDHRSMLEQKTLSRFKNAHLGWEEQHFEDWLDWRSGSVRLADEMVVRISTDPQGRLLLNLYDLMPDNLFHACNKWFLNRDHDVLLRGVNNYYFTLCCLPNDRYCHENPEIILKEPISFFERASELLSNQHLKSDNWYHFLATYSLADNLFNFSIIVLYWLTKKSDCNAVSIEFYDTNKESSSLASELFEWIKILTSNWYNLVFKSGIEPMREIVRSLNSLVNNLAPKIAELAIKGHMPEQEFRNWRETDNFIENVMVLEDSIEACITEKHIAKIILLGCNYGSIHLVPIAASLVSQKYSIDTVNGVIFTGRTYREIYSTQHSMQIHETVSQRDAEQLCIIIDDNIVSGRSLDEAWQIALEYGFLPEIAIVCRYPGINRLLQMFCSRNEACLNLDLWGNTLQGMLYPAHFTKLLINEQGEYYVDSNGVFDVSKEEIYSLLEKNRIFEETSVIAKWKKAKKNVL